MNDFHPILPEADQSRIEQWIHELDQFNATPGEGVTRQYLTDEEWNARLYLRREMEALGLQVEMDCMGDLLGTLPGSQPDLSPVWTGSHFDTVLHGGSFDGAAGVVTALEAVRRIIASGAPRKRDLTVVAYSAEEPARFGIGCIGSRAMAGMLTVPDLKKFCDKDGLSLYDALKARGLNPDDIASCRRKPGDVFCSLELHIEQNSVLERAGVPLGIVKAICAPLNLNVTVTGQAAHAGGMPMSERKDAFAAACEMSLALERMTRENRASEYCTGTVGSISIAPNASNIIPREAVFTVDIRDCDAASKDALLNQVQTEFQAIAQRRGVGLAMTLQNNDTPAVSHPALMELLEKSCQSRGIACQRLISGPFHDSMMLASFTPIGMLFVPSRDGLSHCPEEWTDPAYLKAGAQVLGDALLELVNRDAL